MFEAGGVEPEIIDRLTDSKNSEGAAFFLANMFFGNANQSKGVQRFSLNNEYFKQFFTFLGNAGRYRTDHEALTQLAWLRAADPYYDDYEAADAAQSTGYRRVFIIHPASADVTGVVKDADGNTVASFKNDSLLSRTDEWIGITHCDSGCWLRLPIDKDYKVRFRFSQKATISLKIADYSVDDGKVMRTVRNDNNLNWTGVAAKPTEEYSLNIPGADCYDGKYDLTSAYYSLVIKQDAEPADTGIPEVYSSSIPKVKNLKVTSASKSMTVTWKKLSAKQRKKYSRTEVQYSTDSKFSKSATVKKEVSRTKNSLKIKNLKNGKTYYVRVRNLKYKNDKKYVSKWTSVKKVKIK
jgi:hypothetical protein